MGDSGKVLKRILRDELVARHQGVQGPTEDLQKGATP